MGVFRARSGSRRAYNYLIVSRFFCSSTSGQCVYSSLDPWHSFSLSVSVCSIVVGIRVKTGHGTIPHAKRLSQHYISAHLCIKMTDSLQASVANVASCCLGPGPVGPVLCKSCAETHKIITNDHNNDDDDDNMSCDRDQKYVRVHAIYTKFYANAFTKWIYYLLSCCG